MLFRGQLTSDRVRNSSRSASAVWRFLCCAGFLECYCGRQKPKSAGRIGALLSICLALRVSYHKASLRKPLTTQACISDPAEAAVESSSIFHLNGYVTLSTNELANGSLVQSLGDIPGFWHQGALGRAPGATLLSLRSKLVGLPGFPHANMSQPWE